MATVKRKVFLTFPQRLIKEPIIYDLGRTFPVVTNIRGASVTDEIALVALLLEGEEAPVEAALRFLGERGVKVENLEDE
ncbi:MAG: NIL domain-containing protein [Planctomycetes bacterium]|nr:NIL domain-containing protein [Planctomycetota bacterium]